MKKQTTRLISLLLTVMLLLAGGAVTAMAAPRAAAPRRSMPTASGRIQQVYVGGMPFGVKFFTDGVMVVGFCDLGEDGTGAGGCNPARDAGIQIKDVITAVNGTTTASAADLTRAVEASAGKPLTLTVKRHDKTGGRELTVTVTPMFSTAENRYKTGIWVRDSGAGIGTVTYIDPVTGAFGGLGHGICDGDTGELIPMQRGRVCDVTISGIEKGRVGDPGAIKGYFAPGKTGALTKNTDCGVFGVLAECPSSADRLIDVATRGQVKEGKATVRCTLDNGKIGEYTVMISKIDTKATGSKCFTVTVTDPALIEKTGGIVQGMSGSPIIQNGKLIGAVTHVLVNDPTTGYGIFIENMLNAANIPMAKAS